MTPLRDCAIKLRVFLVALLVGSVCLVFAAWNTEENDTEVCKTSSAGWSLKDTNLACQKAGNASIQIKTPSDAQPLPDIEDVNCGADISLDYLLEVFGLPNTSFQGHPLGRELQCLMHHWESKYGTPYQEYLQHHPDMKLRIFEHVSGSRAWSHGSSCLPISVLLRGVRMNLHNLKCNPFAHYNIGVRMLEKAWLISVYTFIRSRACWAKVLGIDDHWFDNAAPKIVNGNIEWAVALEEEFDEGCMSNVVEGKRIANRTKFLETRFGYPVRYNETDEGIKDYVISYTRWNYRFVNTLYAVSDVDAQQATVFLHLTMGLLGPSILAWADDRTLATVLDHRIYMLLAAASEAVPFSCPPERKIKGRAKDC